MANIWRYLSEQLACWVWENASSTVHYNSLKAGVPRPVLANFKNEDTGLAVRTGSYPAIAENISV